MCEERQGVSAATAEAVEKSQAILCCTRYGGEGQICPTLYIMHSLKQSKAHMTQYDSLTGTR